MTDKFDQIMEKFLRPVDELAGRIKDSTYFLRRDGCFVFSHGYCHPTPGQFIGKIIGYPTPEGALDIWGRRYEVVHKTRVDGKHVAVLNDAQILKQFEIDPTLDPDVPRPLLSDYLLEFPLSDFVGYFDPPDSLRNCRELYPQVGGWAEETAELLDFPLEKLGVTGSLAYGVIEEADMDFDVIFMGDLEENDRVLKKLLRLSQEERHRVFEFGKYWPIRICHHGFLICSFFVYQNWEDVPLGEAELELERQDVEGTALIIDDFHNSYVPIVLGLGELKIDGEEASDLRLICYDGSLRGEYRKGERIAFNQGRLLRVKDRRGESRVLVVDFSQKLRKLS